MSVEITNIQIKTSSGKVIDLTKEEAKELHGELNEMFGKTQPINLTPYVVERDRYFPPRPYYNTTTWCSNDGKMLGDYTQLKAIS